MTNDLGTLLERVKAATGPDAALDLALADALLDYKDRKLARVRTGYNFTASVGAALSLVERCLPGWGVQFGTLKGGGARARVALDWPEIAPLDECHDGATKPLAILAALLSALPHSTGEDP